MNASRGPVILLASRDPLLAYLIQRYAGNCGCQIFQTDYGAGLIDTIEQNRPDVILIDVSRTEGQIAAQELKTQMATRFIPIILCAASEMDWLDCEAEGRLLRPILFSDFVNAIAEVGIRIPKNPKEV